MYREANQVADLLASKAQMGDFDISLNANIYPELANLLAMDAYAIFMER